MGELSALSTTNKSSIVNAINEVKSTEAQDVANLQDGLAIVANGNTHVAIASGQFVYVKNHGSLSDGLYTANSAIGANGTLSTSNLTADASGGLNALNGNKTNYLEVTATSYTYNAKESYDYVYDQLPSPYFGMIKITFGGGYHLFGMAHKYTNIYGSIMTIVNDNVLPFYYTRSNSTHGKLEQLALNSKFATVEGTTSSAIDTEIKLSAFPDGFNETNCVVVGSMIKYSDNKWYSNFDGNIVSTNDTGVWAKVHNSGFCNKLAKVVICKI